MVSFLSCYFLCKNVNFDMIVFFLFCELKLKVLSESVSLAISTCQSVSSELQFRSLMSI